MLLHYFRDDDVLPIKAKNMAMINGVGLNHDEKNWSGLQLLHVVAFSATQHICL